LNYFLALARCDFLGFFVPSAFFREAPSLSLAKGKLKAENGSQLGEWYWPASDDVIVFGPEPRKKPKQVLRNSSWEEGFSPGCVGASLEWLPIPIPTVITSWPGRPTWQQRVKLFKLQNAKCKVHQKDGKNSSKEQRDREKCNLPAAKYFSPFVCRLTLRPIRYLAKNSQIG